MQAILNIAIRAARQAGAHLLRERVRMDAIIGGKDLTTLQGQAETMITEVIAKAYPEHGINAVHSGLEAENKDTVWHLDIVNGLQNFARNIPHYAIVMLIEDKGMPKYTLVFDPMTDEIFTAYKGGGVQCNEYRLRVSNTADLENVIIASAQSQNALMDAGIEVYNQGSPILALAYVAAGRIDAFCGENLSPIELKVGNMLVKEAGGLIGDLQGGHDMATKKQLLAANTKLFKALVQKNKS
jgi:myo-inositol-1(or 4)-monophosphatase